MSIESWEDEFYKEPADNFLPDPCWPVRTRQEALEHSLLKWQGLRPENLARHEVTRVGSTLVSFGRVFGVTSDTCALCALTYGRGCEGCPLVEANGGYSCDGNLVDPDDYDDLKFNRDVYNAFVWGGDPEPMIELIEKALNL